MMKEFKPCPFCGYSDIEYRLITPGIIQNFMIARCRNCNAMIIDMDSSHCPNDIVEQWNRRASDE